MFRSVYAAIAVCFALLLGLSTKSVSQELHSLGALRSNETPEWVLPSPVIEVENPENELDEFVANLDGLPPVGNQSSQGSCTAWATAYYYLTYTQWQEYGWDVSDPNHIMSPAFTYNQINGGIDGGSYPHDAFRIFESMGCVTIADMPYDVGNYTRYPSEQAQINGMPFRTQQTYEINIRNMNGVDQLKNHLRNGNIAMTAMTVWPNFDNLSNFDYNYCVNDIYGGVRGGHAVTIIGFDDERVTSDGVGAFYMVNSWGSGWGDDGFWWMSYEAMMEGEIGWGYALYAEDIIGYEPTLAAKIDLDHFDRYSLRVDVGLGLPGQHQETKRFFDVYMRPHTDIWHFETPFVLDITDFDGNMNLDGSTDFFMDIDDGDRDGMDGDVFAFEILDLTSDFRAISGDTPLAIPDGGSTEAGLTFNYSIVPPSDVTVNLDLATGETMLSWQAPEIDEFIEFIVYRNGQEIGRTNESSFIDQLEHFGLYGYEIASHWEENDSWATEIIQVNYIEPVAPRYTGVLYVEEGTGEFSLAWEQFRDIYLSHDDGIAESNIYPGEQAPDGTIIAQKFTAPALGKVFRARVKFAQLDHIPYGPVRVVVLRDENGTPGSLFYASPVFTPQNTNWMNLEFDGNRLALDADENFWIGLCWEESQTSPLGRDTNGAQTSEKMIQLPGMNWRTMAGGGNLMIRADFASEELIDDWTGLTGFDVFMNDELLTHVDEDIHRVTSTLPDHGEYTFRVDAVYLQGVWQGRPVHVAWNGEKLAVGEDLLPGKWAVHGVYPNPFNPTTTIRVELAENAPMSVNVFNLQGQLISTLFDGMMTRGNHEIIVDGGAWTSGVYFIQTRIPGQLNDLRKVTLLK
ncbi:T9SS type A sorting domain-containing protein [bacterium]|nr:T9SS type A sorting domain-containing protein [bacterium]